MTSTVKSLSFALSLCLSLTTLTACGPNTTPMSSTTPQQSGAQSGLSLEAQAALASYHDADASFSDTSRLASSGQFKTKLLDGGSGSGSGSISIGVGASGSGSTSGGSSSTSSTGSTSGSVGVGVDASASGSGSSSSGSSTGSGGGSVGVGVGANVGGSTSGSSNGTSSGSGSLGVGVGANVDASGSSNSSSTGSGSGSVGVGVGANASGSTTGSATGTNSGSGSGSLGGSVGVDTNVNANGSTSNSGTGSSNSMLNLGTNLNANAMLDAFNRYSSLEQNRSRFASNGSVSFDSQGNANVDDSRLASNITSRLNANADLQSMLNNSSQSSAMAATKIDANSLVRLRNRNFETTGSELGSRTNADGSVTSSFMTRFVGNGTDRSISYASQQQGNARVGANAVLNETGTGFTRTGSRQSAFQADGSAEVMTSVMTTLSNGDKLEVFEDRFTSAQGEGSGFGSFRVTRNDGSSTSGDLRTLISADGSLTTFFDSDDNNQDFALRSDANGSLSFVGRGSNGSFGDNWSMLDFSTVLNSAIQASSSRSGNRSGANASASANTATSVMGSSRSN